MKVGQMGTGQLGIDRFGGAVPTVQAVVDLDAVRVAKRDPADGMVPYDRQRIRNAIMKAFLAEQRSLQGEALDHRVDPIVDAVEQQVAQRALGRPTLSVAVEEIQDQVELVLMKSDHEEVARRYIIYREDRARERAAQAETTSLLLPVELMVALPDGTREPLDLERLKVQIEEACHGLDGVSADDVLEVLARDVYNDITPTDLRTAQIMAARSLVEQDPDYSKVSARLVITAIDFTFGKRGEAHHATAVVVGDLATQPHKNRTMNGTEVSSFELKVVREVRGKTKTTRIDVSVFGRSATACNAYLYRGRSVEARGRVRLAIFQGRDGVEKGNVELVADDVTFLTHKVAEASENAKAA